ncbi:secreted protein [Rhodopirellula maiorica SM1]|uniref:Secreted protein n=1 Tax=Rhodopirellula maiorica SM1 TaxID=1265738 RepID=M5RNE2_9BACT|nr:secreted protein [Rhodopirellula maiorica]EMI15504.1 secreted protein [Rhodopirellula maiorica SM1]
MSKNSLTHLLLGCIVSLILLPTIGRAQAVVDLGTAAIDFTNGKTKVFQETPAPGLTPRYLYFFPNQKWAAISSRKPDVLLGGGSNSHWSSKAKGVLTLGSGDVSKQYRFHCTNSNGKKLLGLEADGGESSTWTLANELVLGWDKVPQFHKTVSTMQYDRNGLPMRPEAEAMVARNEKTLDAFAQLAGAGTAVANNAAVATNNTPDAAPSPPALVNMTIRNATGQAMEMFWVGDQGQEQSYGTIQPNQSVQQGSYVGGNWMFKSSSGLVLNYRATAEVNQLHELKTNAPPANGIPPNGIAPNAVAANGSAPMPANRATGGRVLKAWKGRYIGAGGVPGYQVEYRQLPNGTWGFFDTNGRQTSTVSVTENADGSVMVHESPGSATGILIASDGSASHLARTRTAPDGTQLAYSVGGFQGKWSSSPTSSPNQRRGTAPNPTPKQRTRWVADPGSPTGFTGSFAATADGGQWILLDGQGNETDRFRAEQRPDGGLLLRSIVGESVYMLRDQAVTAVRFNEQGETAEVSVANGRWK